MPLKFHQAKHEDLQVGDLSQLNADLLEQLV
jgi:hypothetical protein